MQKNKIYLVLLLVIGLLPLVDFLKPGLPITHDGQDHVARIANFFQSLSEGNLVPRWAGNLNWGYGHPILMFLYPLPSYLASFFHFLGFSLVASTKVVFVLSFMFSGVFMYLWLSALWDSAAGFVGGLIYMFAPYRFVDLYVRGALGECLAFVWPPLICLFLFKFARKGQWRDVAGGALSLAALILSHNALSLMFLLLIFGYAGHLLFNTEKKLPLFISYGLLLILGFGLAAFFWAPAFFEGKYTLRDVVTQGQIAGFVPWRRLIWSPWSFGITGQFSAQLGLVQWLMVLVAPFLIWRLHQRRQPIGQFLLFLFWLFWTSLFLILSAARPLYLRLNLLQKFQFAWRWLSLAVFPPAVLGAGMINFLPKKTKTWVFWFLVLALLAVNQPFWHAQSFLKKEESFFTGFYPSPTDTGESAPRWSVRFMENYPTAPLAVIEGEAVIKEIGRETNRHEYWVSADKSSRLVESTLYFPGWQVLVDRQLAEIQFQDPDYRGLMTFWVEPGEHQVVLFFGETKFRQLANLVSLASLGLLIGGGSVVKLRKPCLSLK